MHAKRVLTLVAVVVTSLLIASCTASPIVPLLQSMQAPEPSAEVPAAEVAVETAVDWVAPEDALVSILVADAPTLDGVADDAVWANAVPIIIPVEDGANMGETEISIQSVYTDDRVYFLMTWADPTESFMRSPWLKQDDGSWTVLVDPDDRGSDNNVFYEDKMSIIWPINESIPRFERLGCYTACHVSGRDDPKPYGNEYTDEEGQMADIWHWKSVRNVNQVDDQYLDSTPYSPETPSAGRHADPKEAGGYVTNRAEDADLPMWMGPEGFPKDGSPGYIPDSEKQPFDDSLFAPGDLVPGVVTAPIEGDRGDISAGWQYTDGMWTLEFGRDLVTGSEYDVQFDDLARTYYFGAAVFDNAQVRHAYQDGASAFVFQP